MLYVFAAASSARREDVNRVGGHRLTSAEAEAAGCPAQWQASAVSIGRGYLRVLAPFLAIHLHVLRLCDGVERALTKTSIVSAGVGASGSGANADRVDGRWRLLACGYHPRSPPLNFMLYVFATAMSACSQRR